MSGVSLLGSSVDFLISCCTTGEPPSSRTYSHIPVYESPRLGSFTCPPIDNMPGYAVAQDDTHVGFSAAAARGCRATFDSAAGPRSTRFLSGRLWGSSLGFFSGAFMYSRIGDRSCRSSSICLRRSASVMASGGLGRSAAVRTCACAMVAVAVEGRRSRGNAQEGTTPAITSRARVRKAVTSLRACGRTVHHLWVRSEERSR